MDLLADAFDALDEEWEKRVNDMSKVQRTELEKLMAVANKLTRDQQVRLAALRVASWGNRNTEQVLEEAKQFERFIRGCDKRGKAHGAAKKKAR